MISIHTLSREFPHEVEIYGSIVINISFILTR